MRSLAHLEQFYCVTFAVGLVLIILQVIRLYREHCYESQHQVKAFEVVKSEDVSDSNLKFHGKEHQTEEIRHLIGNVAHDMKTPASAIESGLEMLKESFDRLRTTQELSQSPVSVSQEMDNIADNIQTLQSTCFLVTMMINRYTDFTKISCGMSLIPHETSFMFAECVHRLISVISSLEKNRLIFDPAQLSEAEADDLHMIADSNWLFESLLTLTTNAFKFSGSCEPQVKLFITKAAEQVLHFEVEDNGVGVPEDLREAIFRPHLLTVGQTGGTGLGLFSLATRMKVLGGECGVKSRENGQCGAVFWFDFPYKTRIIGSLTPIQTAPSYHHSNVSPRVPSKGDDSSCSSACPSDSRVSSPRLSVLVVDDSLPILRVTKNSLEGSGHRVFQAKNGLEAVNIAAENKIDVILMDIEMPIMNGIDATKKIRDKKQMLSSLENNSPPTMPSSPCGRSAETFTHTMGDDNKATSGDYDIAYTLSSLSVASLNLSSPRTSVQPIILGCSANSDSETVQNAMNAGMDGFIPKPVTLAKFQKELAARLL